MADRRIATYGTVSMSMPAPDGYGSLTEKEKQTLRLIVRGHDAKSTARHLNLSVHTINERLRDARRKLAVSSSREAARLVFARESTETTPEYVTDKQLGDAVAPDAGQTGDRSRTHRAIRTGTGVTAVSIMIAALALIALPQDEPVPAGNAAGPAADTRDPAIAASARRFLTLIDERKWDESYALTTASFRKLNSRKAWAEASEQARPPLGPLISRTLAGQDDVPAPPQGYMVVRFRTSFANRPNAVEKVSLERAGSEWRVAGVWIE